MVTGASKVGQAAAVWDDPEAQRRFEWRKAIEENRDQWDRPKIMLPDGSKEVGYRRSSNYGSPLEDSSALEKWKMRQVARGVSRRKDYQLQVTRAEVGLDGHPDAAKAAKTELNAICKKAMEIVESDAKATIGTAEHDIFEHVDHGRDPGHVPDEWKPDLVAYRQLTQSFRALSIERFVVQDDHRVGGTLDRAVELLRDMIAPDGTMLEAGSVVIGDVKTAQAMDFAGAKFAVQCWSYATAVPYNPVDKIRIDWGHEPPRHDWAVIFHIPSGSGKAQLHWVNLTAAAAAADQVRQVYEWRNKLGKRMISAALPHEWAEDFHATAVAAGSHAELTAAYQRAVAAGQWNEVLKQAFSRRRREITGASA